ncbi:MAG: dethiobiotin synthase [Verrucomicrobia bacterium]|nr:dethiobiotin synthase [Verrucomicrobiota bacterium]
MKGVFITGTDTGVGKTYFTAFWTRSLRQSGLPAFPLKPISSGDRSDAKALFEAAEGILGLDEMNPIHFQPALAPWVACKLNQQSFPKERLRGHITHLRSKYSGPFLVEGVGGWRVPLDRDYGVREWAQELNLPVVLVARAGLGTLNHVLLTIDSIRQAQLPILGIIVNLYQATEDEASRTNPMMIEELTGLPVFLLSPQAQPAARLPSWLCFKDEAPRTI